MQQPYPAPEEHLIDRNAIEEIEWVKAFIIGVRKIRSGMNIDPRKLLPVMLQNGSAIDRKRQSGNQHYLVTVGRIESVTWLEEGDTVPESATALLGNMKLFIPLSGLIDKKAELVRLFKEWDKKVCELDRCEKKLSNACFVDKAPAAVVEKEQARAAELRNAINNLEEQQQRIRSL